MTIKHREFTYRERMKVSPSDLRLARRGRKKCTIRLGVANVIGGQIALTDGRHSFAVNILSVDADRSYRELSDSDARDEGFESLAELQADLRQYYGPIDPEQPMTVIRFEVAEPETGSQESLF